MKMPVDVHLFSWRFWPVKYVKLI